MVWSPEQRIRLAIEKEQLETHFRLGISWIQPQHETKVEVSLKSNSDKDYVLRVYIPDDFPNSCPVLIVTYPKCLTLQNGSRLPQQSYTFHTLADIDGYHRICHFYPPHWTQDITLYQVFMKGFCLVVVISVSWRSVNTIHNPRYVHITTTQLTLQKLFKQYVAVLLL